MAELGVISSLHAYFKEVPIKFTIEAVSEGKLDEKGWVSGISAIDFKKDLESVVRELEYKGLGESFGNNGDKFTGMESLATFIIKKLSGMIWL